MFRPSMLLPRPRLPLTSLPRHPLTNKGHLSHSKTLGRRRPSTLSASPWTISSSELAIPKHQLRLRFNHCLLSIRVVRGTERTSRYSSGSPSYKCCTPLAAGAEPTEHTPTPPSTTSRPASNPIFIILVIFVFICAGVCFFSGCTLPGSVTP
jgi:hypothetical protein